MIAGGFAFAGQASEEPGGRYRNIRRFAYDIGLPVSLAIAVAVAVALAVLGVLLYRSRLDQVHQLDFT